MKLSMGLSNLGVQLQVAGDFQAQDAVRLCDVHGLELGRGLINYDHTEVDKVKVGGCVVVGGWVSE